MKKLQHSGTRWIAVVLLLAASFGSRAAEEEAATTWDGLVMLEETDVYAAFVDPAADFGVFRRVALIRPSVAFRSNWQRDQNRSRSRNVRASDVERIKEDVADLFMDVFTEQLESAGYEVVNYADEDVLIVRPAVIDLDVSAPDTRGGGRSRTYTATAGAATIFVELFDSLTGDLIGRATDRRTARRAGGFMTQANRVTNRADARRELRVWADQLIGFLDQHYVKAAAAD